MFPPERISRFLSYLLRHRPKESSNPFDRHRSLWSGKVVETVKERFQELTEEQMCAERANEAGP